MKVISLLLTSWILASPGTATSGEYPDEVTVSMQVLSNGPFRVGVPISVKLITEFSSDFKFRPNVLVGHVLESDGSVLLNEGRVLFTAEQSPSRRIESDIIQIVLSDHLPSQVHVEILAVSETGRSSTFQYLTVYPWLDEAGSLHFLSAEDYLHSVCLTNAEVAAQEGTALDPAVPPDSVDLGTCSRHRRKGADNAK